MSASTEKKQRLAAREAGTDKKILAQQEADKKARKTRTRWIIGTVIGLVLIAAVLFFNSGMFYRSIPAATVDGRTFSTAEASYYYGSEYQTMVNQMGSYASLFGLDTSNGYAGLATSDCPYLEEGTWKDYFLQSMGTRMTQIKALSDYAKANGISLSSEEQAEIQEALDDLRSTAKTYGRSLNSYLTAVYGPGVNTSLLRKAITEQALNSAVYRSVMDSQEYTGEQLAEEYASYNGDRDYFDYAYYFVSANIPEETDDETRAQLLVESRETANAIVIGFQERENDDDLLASLNDAVDHEVPGASAVNRSNVAGSSLDAAYKDWLMDGTRKSGDNTVVPSSNEDGFYAVVFFQRENNQYNTVSVRHILVRAEASEDGTYSDEAKEAAYARAQEIYEQWRTLGGSEESFAQLANELSEDEGSNTNGGLYENIYKGQMVQEFNDFCFEGHQHGDVGIVYGESGSYAGYHIVYFVGEGERYCDVIAKDALNSEYMESWLESLTEGMELQERFGYKLVG